MRFLHLADLHLGKRVNEFSMIEDQKYILKEVLNIIREYKVQSVLMAGDVYDKAVPSAEAVILLNDFLTQLSKKNIKTFVISGNHDSAERIGFGSEIMSLGGIYMAKPYNGTLEKVTVKDQWGNINIYMLPFVKPVNVKHVYPDAEINTYDEAIKVVMENTKINKQERNILVAHQFVKGGEKCDSENISVGGVDQIAGEHFEDFDYVALGHLHGPQKVHSDNIRYAGTLLKYSFSEMNHKKNALIVDIGEKGKLSFEKIDLHPLHNMGEIKGTYDEITSRDFYKNMNTDDYLHVILTDREDKVNAMALLRTIYPNIMKLDYDNERTRKNCEIVVDETMESKSPVELFEEFFKMQNNADVSEQQHELIKKLSEEIWENT